MDNKSLVVASLVGGAVSTVLSNTPGLSLINCVLCAGFWAGPLLAVWIYRRQVGAVTMQQGIGIGAAAGAWAGLFGFLLTFTNLAGIEHMMETYAELMPADATAGFADLGPLGFMFNLVGVGFNILFGLLGGLIGGALFATKAPPPEQPGIDMESAA